MVDFLDVKPVLEKQKAERESRRIYNDGVRQQVAVEMKYLTNCQEWNTYLQHLQAIIEVDEKALTSLQGRLLGDLGMADAERDTAMRRIKKFEGRIEALKVAMALPLTLLQDAAKLAEKSIDNA